VKQETKEKSVIAKAAISSELKLQFKILCAQQGLNMSMMSEQLLRDWLITRNPSFEQTELSSETDMEVVIRTVATHQKLGRSQLRAIILQE